MNRLPQLYNDLLSKFGDPVVYWPQWCAKKKTMGDREKIIIGMILVQHTSWHNADIALKNLKKNHLLSVDKIARLGSPDQLTDHVRPAGFFHTKPKRLFDICSFIVRQGGIKKLINSNIDETRKMLLEIKGVGPETADTILLYALDKSVFVIDEYTRRWVEAANLHTSSDYHQLQHFFQSHLPEDLTIYRNFHALIIISQRGETKSQMDII